MFAPALPTTPDVSAFTRLHWLALTRIESIGSVRCQVLMERFQSPENAFRATRKELSSLCPSLPFDSIEALLAGPDLLWARRQVSQAEAIGASIICWDDPDYPPPLRQIPSPPPVLFAQGVLGLPHARAVAVVGTRNPTTLGESTTRQLCQDWARNGIRIVSGLARGIDETAHRTALEQGGETVAVLGCPLDGLGTSGRGRLSQQIAAAGTILTEHPFDAPVKPGNFVRRNRIISGLSQAVVVVEAPEGSGALITARNALEQNRELLACPGPANAPSFAGCFSLLRQGAGLCAHPDDLWSTMGWKARPPREDDPSESPVVKLLRRHDATLEELVLETQTPIALLQGELVLLELSGRIARMGGPRFRFLS